MAMSESSSVASASAAPPKMSTEFSLPRRPKRRCSMPRPFLAYLLSFPLHSQRNHLEGPHTEAHDALMYLDRPFGFFEEVDALHPLDGATETQRTFTAGTVGFVEAQDNGVPVLRELEAPERELQSLSLQKREFVRQGIPLRQDREEWRVEVEGLARDPRRGPVALVGKEGVRKAMLALVGERVRVERAAEQADADYVPLGAVAVLAVVEDRDAVAWLGEVTEAVGRDFETGGVPGCIVMRRPPHGPEHRLAGGLVGADGEREERSQEDPPLVPADVRLYVQASRAGEEPVGLRDGRASPSADHAHGGAERSVLHNLDAFDAGDLLPLLLVPLVHIPRLPVAGLVRVGPELVGASVQDLTAGLPVIDAVERAVLTHLHAQETIVQNGAPARDLNTDIPGLAPGRLGLMLGRQRTPAESRYAEIRGVHEQLSVF